MKMKTRVDLVAEFNQLKGSNKISSESKVKIDFILAHIGKAKES